MELGWLGACLAWTKPWVLSLAVHKPGPVAHICKLSTREDGEFEASLDYMRQTNKQTNKENPDWQRAQGLNTNHRWESAGVKGLCHCALLDLDFIDAVLGSL